MTRILVSGSSGFIGRALISALRRRGDEVVRLVRSQRQAGKDSVFWDPSQALFHAPDFEGFDAVVHLAGEGITTGRWTRKKKQQLFQSRCRDTWVLSQILSHLSQPPKTILCASAIGIYGDRKGEFLTENSSPGQGFLSDLCVQWEKAMQAAEGRGARVVHLRFGAVLDRSGGMLRKLWLPYRLGLGGKLGTGKQMVSWIALSDAVEAILFLLSHDAVQGAVNLVSPHPVSQEEFAQTLAQALHRPARFSLPIWLLRLILGEMAEAVLLSSAHVVPEKLIQLGYPFQFTQLESLFQGLE